MHPIIPGARNAGDIGPMNYSAILRIFQIGFLVLLSAIGATPVLAQEDKPIVANWSGHYFGQYDVLGKVPAKLSTVKSVFIDYLPGQNDDEKLLRPDSHGRIDTHGRLTLNDGRSFEFDQSWLIEGKELISLSFRTKAIAGVLYTFDGKYLERDIEVRRGRTLLGYIGMKGVLTKYEAGRVVATSTIGLAEVADL